MYSFYKHSPHFNLSNPHQFSVTFFNVSCKKNIQPKKSNEKKKYMYIYI